MDDRFQYWPWPRTTWFLWWLFFFDLWYASALSSSSSAAVDNTSTTAATGDITANANNNNNNHRHHLPFSKYLSKFPSSILHRWSVGVFVCGVLNKLVARYLLGDSVCIACMPSSEFANHLLFFYVGLLAGEHEWLDFSSANDDDDDGDDDDNDANDSPPAMSPLRRQLGTNVWLFRSFVLLLYGSIVALSLDVHRTLPRPAIFIFESVDNGLTFADNGSDGDRICIPPPLRLTGTGC